jgi:hypothetical protein
LIGLLPAPPGPRPRTDRTRDHQKGGSVPSSGTCATRGCGPIGLADALPAKWSSLCGRGCWLGCVLRRAATRLQLQALTHHEAMRRIPLPWAATWWPPLSS